MLMQRVLPGTDCHVQQNIKQMLTGCNQPPHTAVYKSPEKQKTPNP